MVDRMLSRDAVAFGRAVLLATDALGMSAEGAFWIRDAKDKEWNYFLVTSLMTRIGSREIYLKLNDALAKILSEHELNDFTFYIAAPDELLIKKIRKQIKTDSFATDPTSASVAVNGRSMDVEVYRLSKGMKEPSAKKAQRRFRQSYNELMMG